MKGIKFMIFLKRVICILLVTFSLIGSASSRLNNTEDIIERYVNIIFEHNLTKKISKFYITEDHATLDSVFYNDIESSIYSNKVNIKILNLPNNYTIKSNLLIKPIKTDNYYTEFLINLSYGINDISLQIFDNTDKLIISDNFRCTYESPNTKNLKNTAETINIKKIKYIVEGFPECSINTTPLAQTLANSSINQKIGTLDLTAHENNFINIDIYKPNNELIISSILHCNLIQENSDTISINFNNNKSLSCIISGIKENYTIKLQYFKENHTNLYYIDMNYHQFG